LKCLLFPLLLFIVVAAGTPSSSPAAGPSAAAVGHDFDAKIRPLLQTYCYQCHGQDKEEGGVSFADVKDGTASLRARPLWRRSGKQVKAGEMPPEDAKTPLPPAEKQALLAWFAAAVDSLDCTPANRDPGPAVVRRLNRTEYDNTLRDLLGVPFDSAEEVGMPDDGVVDGFDTLASAMQVSASLLEKYMASADKALDKLFGPLDDVNPTATPRPPGGGRAEKRPAGKNGSKTELSRQTAVDAILFARPADTIPPRDAARQDLARFMRRAYRRPVQPAEVDRFLRLFDDAQTAGRPFDQSVRAALKPVLVSPHFLFRLERTRVGSSTGVGAPVDDHALAVRLSYFLWSTMPDDALAADADAGKLADPAVLDAQVKRMLADPRGKALTDNFAAQWLQLRKLANARPTTEFFPTFTSKLRRAMYDETATFVDHLRTDDHSVLDLLDADYTYANADLAKHYGLDGVTGDAMQRVPLKPGQHRGGLLGMGSVLSLTSHTFRTSPTQRGKYVLEVIFGTPPPPPPANAGMLKDDNAKKGKKGEIKTFRDQLAAHASQKSCAACHARIDPLGFALDNFDAIGSWRESTSDSPLDTKGVLPTGEKIDGVDQLKKVLLDRKEEFARNLADQMLMYAAGRKTDYYDECTIREVADLMKRDGYRFSALVRGIVLSPTFQQRRTGAGN
jgi:hypothetical protein